MTTTGRDDADSTPPGGAVIPFPVSRRWTRASVARALEALRRPCARGEGPALLEALRLARCWWDAHGAMVEEPGMGNGEADWIVGAASDAMELIARAPARDAAGLHAKARLAAWQMEVNGSESGAAWEAELPRSLAEGLARVLPLGEGAEHE